MVKFDLTLIPAGSIIVEASLIVTVSFGGGIVSDAVIHPITAAWNEMEVTWKNRTTAQTWADPGGDFDPSTVIGTIDCQDAEDNGGDGFRVDLASTEVQKWVDDPSLNHGFIIKLESDSTGSLQDYGHYYVLASDMTNIDQRPALEITYLPSS